MPPIWSGSLAELEQRVLGLRSHNEMLQILSRRTRIVASACSGAALLANAGLLSGRRATTCWWLAEWLQRRFPDIEVLPDRLIVADKDRWTAAAGSAYMHLGLELVNVLAGPKVSAATARLLLVERRRGSQSPFMVAGVAPIDAADRDLDRAVRFMQKNIGNRITVSELCRRVAVYLPVMSA